MCLVSLTGNQKMKISLITASKYAKLYNIHNSSEETLKIIESLNINNNDLYEIEYVMPEIVYQAIMCINLNSNDVNFSLADILHKHLTVLVQAFFIHGYVPKELISYSLKPIIKEKTEDKFSSDN